MMPAKVIVFMLMLVVCCRALPLRTAAVYETPFFAVPIFIQDLEEPQEAKAVDDEPMYLLNNDRKVKRDATSLLDVAENSADSKADDYDDLETAAGTNVLRPLFVYRQQIAYRQRVREANRRGRRI